MSRDNEFDIGRQVNPQCLQIFESRRLAFAPARINNYPFVIAQMQNDALSNAGSEKRYLKFVPARLRHQHHRVVELREEIPLASSLLVYHFRPKLAAA